ncbi:hypothetical protein CBR_g17704 [Chara braunii]|uniref:Uncharacterized protein n=1 Tax=Chara braunii TaxID=69332 RepID=A0A388KV96_CHABU|nr:hypothetical protein CBR_g17704 [Chara braunii]|eukprot:GBG73994.1 hypothetical protein CBR_g17704 [Chara braunii]
MGVDSVICDEVVWLSAMSSSAECEGVDGNTVTKVHAAMELEADAINAVTKVEVARGNVDRGSEIEDVGNAVTEVHAAMELEADVANAATEAAAGMELEVVAVVVVDIWTSVVRFDAEVFTFFPADAFS